MFRGLQLQWQMRREMVFIAGSTYLFFAVNDNWFLQARIAMAKSGLYTCRPMVHGALREAVPLSDL